MITMIVKPQSWIGGDGFDVLVTNGERVLLIDHYRYGWDVSYCRNDRHPFVGDFLNGIVEKYEVQELIVKPGKYTFSGHDMGDDEVKDFINSFFDEDLRLLLDKN